MLRHLEHLCSTADSTGMNGVMDELSIAGQGSSPRAIKKMSPEEEEAWNNGGKDAILGSEDFSAFITSSSRLIERAMTQASSFDILMNVTNSGHENVKRHSTMLTDASLFECDYLKGRPVLDIHLSSHVDTQQDLFLVAYGSIGQASLADGKPYNLAKDDAVLIYGIVLLRHPEKKLTAPSPVLASRFHTDDQNLVLVLL